VTWNRSDLEPRAQERRRPAAVFAAQALTGFWWIDSVGSLAIVWLLVKEGREAWAGEGCACG
jgi:hypothetical protein